jgi:uncharacterized protein (PEP-CTERM system associated)
VGVAALAWCMHISTATAFPLTDQTNPSIVPSGANLAVPDLLDLEHQMGLATGFASLGSQQGWTILPRISVEEEYTDNILEVPSPRRWDLTTIVAPGVAVLGNSDRAQLQLNYQPVLQMHLINGSQNVLTQQLNAVGTLTLVPELFFVDLRAVAGVQATNGGIGGLGGVGQPGISGVGSTSFGQQDTGGLGLAKKNLTQTASVAVSPYMLYQFGDIGTGKAGVSLSESSYTPVTGFAPIPLVSSGSDSQHLSTVEEFAQFQTGEEFNVLRYTFTADGRQSTSSGAGITSSTRDTVNNRVDYQINRTFDVYGQIGWEDISYTGNNLAAINDLTWGVGTVLTPNPDSTLTIGYGHQNGRDSFLANARYAVTPRTFLTANYTNGVGTQLEQVNDQLGQSSVGNNGGLVNSQTGAPVFVNNNALGVSGGVFRYSYLSFSAISTLDRDTLGLTLGHSQESQLGIGGTAGTSNAVTTGNFTWTHELTPDLVSTVTAAFSSGTPTAGTNSKSYVASVSLQYILTETVTTFARYTYYDVQSSTAGASWYQDLFLVGITKQF